MSPKNIAHLLTVITLSILISSLTVNIYALLHNSLENNKNWRSTNLELEKYVNGSPEYFTQTQALAFGKLNLGIWNGYQEIINTKPYDVSSVNFDFQVSKKSYIDFIINKNSSEYSSIRISGNPQFPSAVIKQKPSGEFNNIQYLPLPTVSPNIWHRFHLDINHQNGYASVLIDNEPAINTKIKADPTPSNTGFRGSFNPGYVDNLTIFDKDKSPVFTEDFTFHDPIRIYKMIILSLLFICYHFLTIKRSNRDYFLVSFQIGLLASLFILKVSLTYYYIDRFPNYNSPFYKIKYKLTSFFQKPHPSYNEIRTQEIHNSVYDDHLPRILFLGTSQTWGAGASTENKSYVSVFKQFAESLPRKYQIINAGISGSYSGDLLNYYQNQWLSYNPKIVVIDLSSNDKNPFEFKDNLRKLAILNKQQGIITIFVLEANSPESVGSNELPMHQVMQQVAKEFNIRTVDIHKYLLENNHKGNLWWDHVHPTDFGHRLLGQYLFDNVKDLL